MYISIDINMLWMQLCVGQIIVMAAPPSVAKEWVIRGGDLQRPWIPGDAAVTIDGLDFLKLSTHSNLSTSCGIKVGRTRPPMPILEVLRKLRNSAVERVALETMKEEDEMWCQDELPRNNLRLTSSMPRTVKIMLPSVESYNEESCGACELNAIADLNQSKSVHIELSRNALHYIRVASLALDDGSIAETHFTPNVVAKRQRRNDSDRVVLESPNVKADYRRMSLFITYLDADGRPHKHYRKPTAWDDDEITKTEGELVEWEAKQRMGISPDACARDACARDACARDACARAAEGGS